MKSDKKGQRVQSVERALYLLEILSQVGNPMTLSDISEKAGLNISTVHRLLHTLISHQFVQQDLNSGRYRLGLRIFEIGSKALYSLDIRQVARPDLQELVDTCNETVNMAILDQGEVVYIEQVESTNMIKMFARVGSRGPAHCTGAGKVLLSYVEEPELTNILKNKGMASFTPHTITEPNQLREELSLIRERGYSLDIEEMEEGVKCIAAPIRDHEGRVIAAVSISGPVARMTEKRLKDMIIQNLTDTTQKISINLGYQNMSSERVMDLPLA
ncbi:IclR family transcriptional regulator [Candidatus Contubernalis alkaliaceticus]|uniref:IclR family transcriptional regulator n=1 Tax=Candidatus Contubernalis alkaliaceticus TaxID=338645 RepID=UPI001F4C399F|nr:IclR family transcriptional regulator [Candidatus Contubernalis alkalaceticus]UNC90883.1 IclR family transcriptional regulator [Candidatus Contubernalis alkalaceticus]